MKFKSFNAHSVAKLVMIAAKEASGTASWYGSGQPKEPEVLKAYFSNVKDIEKLDKQLKMIREIQLSDDTFCYMDYSNWHLYILCFIHLCRCRKFIHKNIKLKIIVFL